MTTLSGQLKRDDGSDGGDATGLATSESPGTSGSTSSTSGDVETSAASDITGDASTEASSESALSSGESTTGAVSACPATANLGQRSTSGMAALADAHGFIVAWPDGIDENWNLGPCCTASRDVDDLGFALAVVDELQRDACIDAHRMYA